MPDERPVLRLWFVVSTSSEARQLWRALCAEPRWGVVGGGLGTHGGRGERLVVDFATDGVLDELGTKGLRDHGKGTVMPLGSAPGWLAACEVESVIRPGGFEIVYPRYYEARQERQRLFDSLPAAAATPLDVCAC